MATKSKPTDVTGRVREQLQEQAIEAQQDAANQMSMATAQARVDLETNVIDATKPSRQTVIVDDPVTVGSTDDSTVEIRVVQDIDNMTLGKGNNYSFKAGVKYKVTKHVAEHLKEKGYLAGVI
jgi:hypothetical protein